MNYDSHAIGEFESDWFKEIESEEYLALDRFFPYSRNVLKQLAETCQLYLVTSRQFEDRVHAQLKTLRIENFFTSVMVTGQKLEKAELINLADLDPQKEDLLIGDTGQDVETARLLGVQSIAVLSGFSNRAILKKYSPDHILDSIESVASLLNIQNTIK